MQRTAEHANAEAEFDAIPCNDDAIDSRRTEGVDGFVKMVFKTSGNCVNGIIDGAESGADERDAIKNAAENDMCGL